MSKKNLLHLLAIIMVAMLSVSFASCGDDEDDNLTPNGHSANPETPADPEGTIMANLSCGSDLSFSGMPFYTSYGVKLSKDYNFSTSKSYYWVGESSYIRYFSDIVSIGSVNGLSFITKVPEKGWTDNSAAVSGYGYVVRYKYGYFPSREEAIDADADALPNVVYVRLYVTDYITNNSDGGCTIKYQVWNP